MTTNGGEANRVRANASDEVSARLDRERYTLKALRADFNGVGLDGNGSAR
jgi:hypothetical protein